MAFELSRLFLTPSACYGYSIPYSLVRQSLQANRSFFFPPTAVMPVSLSLCERPPFQIGVHSPLVADGHTNIPTNGPYRSRLPFKTLLHNPPLSLVSINKLLMPLVGRGERARVRQSAD
ncbi:adenylate cyclase [Anopheles sinensis]|uniref:Adenylate cyclase n=1 Tax=Anopheles sinensis TaxID=74873 RepID=A0A084WB69_ANOSI|nr:adenylate cyclase [Anopheles sinensis]